MCVVAGKWLGTGGKFRVAIEGTATARDEVNPEPTDLRSTPAKRRLRNVEGRSRSRLSRRRLARERRARSPALEPVRLRGIRVTPPSSAGYNAVFEQARLSECLSANRAVRALFASWVACSSS